jgi:hypothetical protein
LSGGLCLPRNCSTKKCTACPNAQYLSAGQCLSCPSIFSCANCSAKDPLLCVNCIKNYYLESNGQCYACIAGCDSCISKYTCEKALPGYYLNSAVSLPVKCPAACATCENDYVCDSCDKDYTIYHKKCISAEAVRVNITVKPTVKEWDGLTKANKNKNLLASWNYYQGELMKLIGYDGR